MIRRIIITEKPPIRTEMENAVTAVNKYLAPVVKRMCYIYLLRSMHPLSRMNFARQLHEKSLITKDEKMEFVKTGVYNDIIQTEYHDE